MEKKIKELARRMNMQSTIKVPLVKTIVNCFRLTFTEHDIDMMLKVEPGKGYTLEELSFIDSETLKKILNRGGIWYHNGLYELAPIFPGWIEVMLSAPLDEDRVKVMQEFVKFKEFLRTINVGPIRALLNHSNMMALKDGKDLGHMSIVPRLPNVVKIDLNVDLNFRETVISKHEVLEELSKHKEHLAVMNCFCRVLEESKGHKCRYNMPIKACLNIGGFADKMIEYGISEKIEFEDAVSLVEDLSKKGAVHSVFHYNNDVEQDSLTICNCCNDCCSLYGNFNKGSISNIYVKAFYESRIYNEDNCVGCNMCYKYCPTGATYFDKEKKKLVLKLEDCIGCGQCALKCRFDVRDMVSNERTVFVKARPKRLKRY